MNPARISYRTRQFFSYLGAKSARLEIDKVQQLLNLRQLALFQEMHKAEQLHSLEVFHRLIEAGETDPDLLVAALLHDVGKMLLPLHILERVWVVLAGAFLPGRVKIWGEGDHLQSVRQTSMPGDPPWWRKPFLTAQQHPAWGAELAAQAGCSTTSVALIRRHQAKLPGTPVTREDALLSKLQEVDDMN